MPLGYHRNAGGGSSRQGNAEIEKCEAERIDQTVRDHHRPKIAPHATETVPLKAAPFCGTDIGGVRKVPEAPRDNPPA
jgi:hypothetical protein